MNDETNPTQRPPNNSANLPTFEFKVAPAKATAESLTLRCWLKRLLVCNPFYLASAALLLYGVYRLSVDPNLFTTELRQLIFNFSALQGYELLLVFTATFLAARRIWYDATLLVVLENLLWIVPFILISQAAFIAPQFALYLCLVAAFLAAGRVGWVRARAGEILPPFRVLWCAIPLLLVNAAWPVIYRHFGETKVGINLTSGAAYVFNELNWFWLLPALAAVLLVLPASDSQTKSQLRRWFPLMLFSFWLMGTIVHLYSLGYVYDFKLRREQTAPLLWMLAWALHFRLAEFIVFNSQFLARTLFVLPLLATLPAALVVESRVFFGLSALNFLAYGLHLCWRRDDRLALQFALCSFAAMVAALPIDFASLFGRPLTQTNLIGLAALVYVIVGALWSRHPKVALLGALAAMFAAGVARQAYADWTHWATQAGFVYFLLHSLRWEAHRHDGPTSVRIILAASWVLHTFAWVRGGADPFAALAIAGFVLMIWAARGMIFHCWQPLAVSLAAGLNLICWPANYLVTQTQNAPAGVLYLVGSVALFGLGTWVAVTKHRWHKPHSS